jgi:hypothetical protein
MHSGRVCFDPQIPFAKGTGMNRYRLVDAQGTIMMSLPILGGRSHHQPLADVRLATEQSRPRGGWVASHWLRMQNGYRRAPYFEYLENDLRNLILDPGQHLMAYNLRVLGWLIRRLQIDVQITDSANLYPLDEPWTTLCKGKAWITPRYYQQFESRTGFEPGLSVLDLLIHCGPRESKAYLHRYLDLNSSNFETQS